jgi:kynurenine formamidase
MPAHGSEAVEPSFRDLPGHAHGVFGKDDVDGALNRITPDRTRAAAGLVTSGRVFSLNAPVDWPAGGPGLHHRDIPQHDVIERFPNVFDDHLDSFFLQGSTQWDSLLHIRDGELGWYNGGGPDTLGVHTWAERGIAGRGVLVDVYGAHESDPGSADVDVIDVAELERCLESEGVTVEAGDILLLHTGWMAAFERLSREERVAQGASPPAPGLASTIEMVEWLWDHGVAAVAADNPALERWPLAQGEPAVTLHNWLIPRLGVAIGELWWLQDLAAACREDGRYAFLVTSAPLNVRGGVGSPPNALAIK